MDVPECVVYGSVLPAGDIGKCLGFLVEGGSAGNQIS